MILFLMIAMNTYAQNSFKAERIQRSASFTVNTTIEKAFPFFGPVREKEWAAGWEPQIVYSNHPEVEEHMIFKTSGVQHGESEFLWMLTQYKPETYFIEYTVSTPQRVWFITVQCKAAGKNTNVTVIYTYTGLTEQGNELNKRAIEKMYTDNLKDWEAEINYYLSTGKQKEN